MVTLSDLYYIIGVRDIGLWGLSVNVMNGRRDTCGCDITRRHGLSLYNFLSFG